MKTQEHHDQASTIHDLSDDLTQEIFFRLPINSVFSCGAASKRWSSLISCPTFKKDYVSRFQTSRLPCTLVSSKMYIKVRINEIKKDLDLLMIINKQHCSGYSVLAVPQSYDKVSVSYYLLDSSNGLFLCMAESRNFYELFICNPIIKQWTKIPESTIHVSFHNCLGLSFTTQIDDDGIITSYKLVIFRQTPHQFEIFKSETATWTTHRINPLSEREWPVVANGLKILTSPHKYRPLSRHKFVALVNGSGIMHWVTKKPLRVLAYDPSNADWYRVIYFPHNDQLDGNFNERAYKDINVFDENLRYLEIFRTPGKGYHLYIWTIEGYDDGGQWHLDHKILLTDFRFYANRHDYKFGQFDSNRLYIWVWYTGELLTYDFRTQKLSVIDKAMGGWTPKTYRPLQEWGLPLMLPVWPATMNVHKEQVQVPN